MARQTTGSKLTYQLPRDERWKGVEGYVGRRCLVHFRGGTYGAFDRQVEGIVLGASHHLTNGNSTGDLIVAETAPVAWKIKGGTYRCVSIALAHVGEIEVLPGDYRRTEP
jgi:hypothetical protein